MHGPLAYTFLLVITVLLVYSHVNLAQTSDSSIKGYNYTALASALTLTSYIVCSSLYYYSIDDEKARHGVTSLATLAVSVGGLLALLAWNQIKKDHNEAGNTKHKNMLLASWILAASLLGLHVIGLIIGHYRSYKHDHDKAAALRYIEKMGIKLNKKHYQELDEDMVSE